VARDQDAVALGTEADQRDVEQRRVGDRESTRALGRGDLLQSLRTLEIAVPRDLSVLLFDEPEWAEVVAPPLAVVRHPTAAIARTAWELLIQRISNPRARPQRVVYSATLVPGPSVAPLRRR
jgi:DNA-binding LacI/PurR family transcriptional regulator